MTKLPDPKIIAMINDLSTASLTTVLCFHPELAAQFRQHILDQYRRGKLPAQILTTLWEEDQK